MKYFLILLPPLIALMAYVFSENFGLYTSKIGVSFVVVFVLIEFYLLYRMRQNSSGQIEQDQLDQKSSSIVDFSKVPAVLKGVPPRPIDKTGNVFLHNEETLSEDMANIGIDRHGEN